MATEDEGWCSFTSCTPSRSRARTNATMTIGVWHSVLPSISAYYTLYQSINKSINTHCKDTPVDNRRQMILWPWSLTFHISYVTHTHVISNSNRDNDKSHYHYRGTDTHRQTNVSVALWSLVSIQTQSLAFLAVFVYATHATQSIAFEWKPGLTLRPKDSCLRSVMSEHIASMITKSTLGVQTFANAVR